MLYADKVRAKLSLGLLCAVTGTCLLALCHACGIECAANDVVTNAGKVFNPAAADKNGRVLLKVVRAFTGLGLVEAKAAVEKGGVLKENVAKEEAEKIVADLKAAGATAAME